MTQVKVISEKCPGLFVFYSPNKAEYNRNQNKENRQAEHDTSIKRHKSNVENVCNQIGQVQQLQAKFSQAPAKILVRKK